MAERIDVFISSTSRDLEEYRAKVTQLILHLGLHPIIMEAFNPTDRNALQLCYDKVQEAEILVGIYAHRYGYVPGEDVTYTTVDGEVRHSDGQIGITELEYRWAMERGIPVLLYVLDENYPWNPNHFEDELGKSRLQAFKNMIGNKHVWKTYQNPDDLAWKVAAGLNQAMQAMRVDKPTFLPTNKIKIVPKLPPNYIERGGLLDELKRNLFGEMFTETQVSEPRKPIALHGMGGIGKTVMAQALCYDESIQALFPDAILWASIGKNASRSDLARHLRSWLNAFHVNTGESAPSLETLKAKLAEVLAEKTCLLVIDDAWTKKQVEAFRVGGERCRLLVTTRDAEIAREQLGAGVHTIPPMTEDEAIQMLDEWALGKLPETDITLKRHIVNKLGRLPLALKLAGAQLQRKAPAKWLDRFDARKLKSKRPEDVHDSLEQTFGLSLEELEEEHRKLYAALAIFKEDEAIHGAAIERLWEALEDYDEDDAEELVHDLASRALLQVAGKEYPRAVVLHDLLRDFIAAELGDGRHEAHQQLIDAYRETQEGKGWHTAPEDGYIYTHLAYHLYESGHDDELFHLLTDSPDWMEAKFATLLDDASYVNDLELAIDQITNNTPDQITRLAALWSARQVVNARTTAYEDDILKAMVLVDLHIEKNGKRTREGLGYARLRNETRKHFDGLFTIYQTLQAFGVADEKLLEEIQHTIYYMENNFDKAYALKAIVMELAKYDTQQALIIAHRIQNESDRAPALLEIVIHLVKHDIQQAQSVAQNIKNKYDKASALRVIATELVKKDIQQALSIIQTIDSVYDKACALTNIATQLTRYDIQEALAIARSIADASKKVAALGNIAVELTKIEPQLAREALEEALATIHDIEDQAWKAQTLRDIVAKCAKYDIELALAIARSIEDTGQRANAMCPIIAVLVGSNDTQLLSVFDEALYAAQSTENASTKANALQNLATEIAKINTQQALAVAYAIEDVFCKEMALKAIAIELIEIDVQQAIAVANAIDIPSDKIALMADIVTYLAIKDTQQALDMVCDAQIAGSKATILQISATNLARSDYQQASILLDEALKVVRNREYASDKVSVLRVISTEMARYNVHQALEIANSITDASTKALALRDMSVRLEKHDVEHVLAIAYSIEDTLWKTLVIVNVAAQLLTSDAQQALYLLEQALATALTISDEKQKAIALREIATEMARVDGERALAIVENITHESDRVSSLNSIAMHLTKTDYRQARTVLDEALAIAYNINNVSDRAVKLRDIATTMVRIDTEQALIIANRIDHISSKASALNNIASHLARQDVEKALSIAYNIEEALSKAQALRNIAVQITDIDTEQALAVAYSIEDMSSKALVLHDIAVQLTKTNPHWAHIVLCEALEISRCIENESDKASAQHNIATQLAKTDPDKALTVARDINKAATMASALCDIAAELADTDLHLAQIVMDEAIAVARSIEHAPTRASVLSDFAAELAKIKQLAEKDGAYSVLGLRGIETFIEQVAEWSQGFEHIEEGLFLSVLREVIRVVSWSRPSWLEVLEIIAEEK